jgi:hypothetical protein
METPRLGQRLVIKSTDVMDHFCWAYTNALLEKLIDLDEKDKIFVDGGNKALHMETSGRTYSSSVTDIAGAVMFELTQQITYQAISQSATPSQVAELISVCREFLDIFKKKEAIAEEPNPETVERCIQRVMDILEGVPLSSRLVAIEIIQVLQGQFSFVPKEV